MPPRAVCLLLQRGSPCPTTCFACLLEKRMPPPPPCCLLQVLAALAEYTPDPSCADLRGQAALEVAVAHGHDEAARLLVSRGACITGVLASAAAEGDLEGLQRMLQVGGLPLFAAGGPGGGAAQDAAQVGGVGGLLFAAGVPGRVQPTGRSCSTRLCEAREEILTMWELN